MAWTGRRSSFASRIPHPDFTYITDKWGDLISELIEDLRFPFDAIELEANG
jgi:hypothetical protein